MVIALLVKDVCFFHYLHADVNYRKMTIAAVALIVETSLR